MTDQLYRSMRGMIDRCRRLAAITSDKDAAERLLELADKMELNLQQLVAGDSREDGGSPQK